MQHKQTFVHLDVLALFCECWCCIYQTTSSSFLVDDDLGHRIAIDQRVVTASSHITPCPQFLVIPDKSLGSALSDAFNNLIYPILVSDEIHETHAILDEDRAGTNIKTYLTQ